VLEAAGPRLTALITQTEDRLTTVSSGHGAELTAHAHSTLEAGGKRLRPILVCLCAAPGDGPPVVSAAVAVELLHMATLVHDDVLDRAALRRGHPTVYAQAGRRAATATGDFLFSRAFAELAAESNPHSVAVLSEASSALARGELMQRADAWRAVSQERYLERCRLKTARLFEAACRLGAISGGRPDAADALGAFGAGIGLAFQLLDDVLDIEGPPERTGKPRGTDLLDGTVTLPLILAAQWDPALDITAGRSGADAVAFTCDRVAATGALAEVRRRALGFVSEAKGCLADLDLGGGESRALELVADGVVARYA